MPTSPKKRSTNRPRNLRRRQLVAQPLEQRQLMAGDVSVQFIPDGTSFEVRIKGDAANNSIEIRQVNDQLVVRGLDDTEVNGGDSDSVNMIARRNGFSQYLLDDIFIDMGSGNDSVFMRNVDHRPGASSIPTLGGIGSYDRVNKDMTINMGAGEDTLRMNDVNVASNLRVDNAGSGNRVERMRFDRVDVGRDFSVNAGHGSNAVSVVDSNAGDDLVVATASGVDAVRLSNVEAGDDINIDTGSSGDLVDIDDAIAEDVFITTNRGNDIVQLDRLDVADQIRIDTERGNDTVSIDQSDAGRIRVYPGRGNDRLAVEETTTDYLDVQMGYGDDTVVLDNVHAASFYLQGGWGTDVLRVDHDNQSIEALYEDLARSFRSIS